MVLWAAPEDVDEDPLSRLEDGRGIWWDDSTRLRSGDWFAFRDPGEQWERTYYQRGTAVEQQIEERSPPQSRRA